MVGVEDRHESDFREVETFTQQVDSHEHVEVTEAQATNDLHSLDRNDVRVQVPHSHTCLL